MNSDKSPLDNSLCLNFSSENMSPDNGDRADRFIPKKICANLYTLYFADEKQQEKQRKENLDGNNPEFKDKCKEKYDDLLKTQLLGQENENIENSKSKNKKKKMISFTTESKSNKLEKLVDRENDISPKQKQEPSMRLQRKIPKMPYKVLDAPALLDDYYLNLMDWSSSNLIGIGLENFVYFWSASNSKVTNFPEDNVSSVAWNDSGRHITVGNTSGQVHLFDAQKQACVRVFEGHSSRVSSMDWNGNIIASGSRDRTIMLRDVREHRDSFCTLTGPAQEVCGVKWSFNENMLASGGNDNKLFLWSLKQQKEITRFHEHKAAVKALGWSPHNHHILASGGGTADRCLRFWNTQTLEMVNAVDTGSQVCNLVFSKNSNELVSTHGFSLNQIIVWDYPTMEKLQTLTGHTMRVLYLSMSPTGQSIVTGAGDETLRFWNVFPPDKSKVASNLP